LYSSSSAPSSSLIFCFWCRLLSSRRCDYPEKQMAFAVSAPVLALKNLEINKSKRSPEEKVEKGNEKEEMEEKKEKEERMKSEEHTGSNKKKRISERKERDQEEHVGKEKKEEKKKDKEKEKRERTPSRRTLPGEEDEKKRQSFSVPLLYSSSIHCFFCAATS